MADNISPEPQGFLTSAEEGKATDLAALVSYALRHGGPGPWGLSARIIGLRLRGIRLRPQEYLAYALYRPGVTPAAIRAFLPARDNRAFNAALRDRRLPQMDAVIEDKLASLSWLAARGLPVAPVSALFRAGGGQAPVPVLTDVAALAAWLRRTGPEGLFGKPVDASWSRGAFAIDGPDGAEALRLADGRSAPIADLAAEIAARYPRGFLFQPRVLNESGLRRHLGAATGSLRLVTVMAADGPQILYGVLKCPAAGAMHDGPTKASRAWAPVDAATGRVGLLRRLDDPAGPDLRHWQDPGAELTGLVLPGFAAARAAVLAGHAAMAGHGILGWDVFLTDAGAMISEVNANPTHNTFQQATRQGLLAEDRAAPLQARRAAVA